MKKTTVKILSMLLCFITSCSKNSQLKSTSGGMPPAHIQFHIGLIDKDSNALFKVPDIFNSKYNPHKITCKDEMGNTLVKGFVAYESVSRKSICNIDTLKSGELFQMFFSDPDIEDTFDHFDRYRYVVSYDNKEFDTIVISRNGNYFEYNNELINWYRGDKIPIYHGTFLIRKNE